MKLASVTACSVAMMLCVGVLSGAEKTIDDFSASGKGMWRRVAGGRNLQIVTESGYVDDDGKRIFDAIPMSFHDSEGHITAYWLDFYKKRGMEVPEGQPGTNPGEMSRRTDVRIVCRLQ